MRHLVQPVTSTQSASSVTSTQSTKTIVCSPQVLAAVTDESLVRLCQCGRFSIQRYNNETWRFEELTLDAIQMELCHRYKPLIRKYARLSTHDSVKDDVESFLWVLFIEAIQRYEAEGDVPFAGYVKSVIHYGHLRFYKKMSAQWRHEVTLRMMSEDDEALAMDQFPDNFNMDCEVLDADEEERLRKELWQAFKELPITQQELLHQIYLDEYSCADIGKMTHTTRQAVQKRHQRALAQLRLRMAH